MTSAGRTTGSSAAGSSTRTSIAAATRPPGPNTGTARALRSGSSSQRATASRLSRAIASARRNRSGAVTVNGVNAVRPRLR
jgi:hypothetical protein